jgi:hypothetical protein
MSSVAVLGATGNVGQRVARQVIERGWGLSVAVRNPGRLDPETSARARVTELDLGAAPIEQISAFAEGHDALVFCAGAVTQGQAFVNLFDRAVSALEAIASDRRLVCWFLAGAAILPLDDSGRRGVDLPKVRGTYWPHRSNFERLQRSTLDWRLLCPGPMVDQPALGLSRLRVSIEGLPTALPSMARLLPAPLLLPLFAMKIPQMIIPYADAASVMLANLQPQGAMSRRRVGVALPVGMTGKKDQWVARPREV